MKPIIHILSLLLVVNLTACSAEEVTTVKEDVAETTSDSKIWVTTAQFENGKMELGGFEKKTFHTSIKTNGVITVSPEDKSIISAYFGGYVKDIALMQGQKVSKGQLLFTLENPEYIAIQQEYLETQNQLTYLKTDYERQAGLFKDNVTSQKTFLKAESDFKVTLTRNESLKKKLQLMNINPANVSENNLKSTIAVTSPIDGYITNIAVSQGMFLNPSDIAITLINTDNLLMELSIFEQDLAHISVGQEVTFSIQSRSEKYLANVYLINKEIDPIKRTIGVYCQLNNKNDGEKLTPGMFVEAEIFTTVDSTFALPIQAISSLDDKDFILIKGEQNDSGTEFIKREVTKGLGDDKYAQILNFNDFPAETEVLTKGAFNLINE